MLLSVTILLISPHQIFFFFEISTAKLMFSETEIDFELNFRILLKYLQAAGQQAKSGRGRRPHSDTTPWYIPWYTLLHGKTNYYYYYYYYYYYCYYYYHLYFLLVTNPSFNIYLIN